jgi:cation diffusion facilitator CzcD-associated flavoprotein CzcO/acetyl esterase/lipase
VNSVACTWQRPRGLKWVHSKQTHGGVVPVSSTEDTREELDVVGVGAGFAGLYLLHKLRGLGFSVRLLEEAADVGGTWYWNRYPGARCDIPTTDYAYSFDPELERDWVWSEKYATQPQILSYLQHVADRYDLRRDIRFSTRVQAATWDAERRRWLVRTDGGDEVACRFLIMATGCLSRPKDLDIPGAGRFRGEVYFTSRWPHEGVDFSGKKVGVIGTGSSGIQCIPLIAEQAAQLVVFQRTANFSIPAHNGPVPAKSLAALKADREAYREAARRSRGGVPAELSEVSGASAPEEVRRQRFETAWEEGTLFGIIGVFNDILFNPVSNEIVAEMIREKIREIVRDPVTAEALCPRDYPFATKRPCLDTHYYETFNLPHVRLVDLRKQPIETITQTGVLLGATPDSVEGGLPATENIELDALVFATGFDAMTGALFAIDITGRDGQKLADRWAGGYSAYLGLATVGFPNLFTITGPGSPSVLSNMTVSIEQHVDWIASLLEYMRSCGFEGVEPTELAEAGWMQHVEDCAAITLYPKANSWYMGANVPGKARVFYPYIGGVDAYRAACEEVANAGYLGFKMWGPAGEACRDGVVRRLQPDVSLMLQGMEALGIPPMESLGVEEARGLYKTIASQSPPGPAVAEVRDGTLPGPAGPLGYRLFRPASDGPHPVIVYFHGGGWVLGDPATDEPLCRDLCVRSGCIVLSVDYRHAPENRFPAAAEDAIAAVRWVAENSASLGGVPGEVAVAGWSAGANLAAVACLAARDSGTPAIAGQVLLSPVTDADFGRPSYRECGEGYVLTAAMMRWFWDHYCDPGQRSDPRASPLRASDLSGLPPAVVMTAEFDPLRDEGAAYAEALSRAGVRVRRIFARGHVHTSVTMVDLVLSGAPVRAEVAEAMRSFFPAVVPA